MRLGFYMGYAPPGTNPTELVALAQEAETLGYDSAWAAEAWGTDAATVLSWLAATTTTLRVGSAIFQIPARTPTNTAMTAATLDLMSGGRFLLGLGLSGPQVVEGWHGEPWGKPITKMREYVEIVRAVLRRETVQHEGSQYQVPYTGPNATGLGKPLKLMARPLRADIPIYLAVFKPRSVQLAAEIADGWLPIFFSPERTRETFPAPFARGDGFDIAPAVPAVAIDDVEIARDVLRPYYALYIGGMGARGANFYNDLVVELRLRGRGEGDPGPLPGRQAARCRRGRARSADRRARARRAARPDSRPACRLEGIRCDDAPDLDPRLGDASRRLGGSLMKQFDLTGKTAIVTGGGKGIGRQMAEGLAEAGANLVLCARQADRCEQAAAELEQLGVKALGLGCDVRDPEQVAAVVERTVADFGGVDVLVNNAGVVWGATPEDMPLEGWQKVVDVNLTGVFLFSQAAGRVMIGGDGGAIVNIASVAGLHGAPPEIANTVVYHATKGGVIAFTRDLAWKWAPHGIRVNAIAPGWFPSDMANFVLEHAGEELVRRVPLRRFGGPEDLKGPVVFLASDASAYVTGHTLVVDGGQSA